MVFQNFQLFPHLSVLENIMQGLMVVQKWPRERARARAEELLAKVGPAHKRHAWPAMLSGGQQRGSPLPGRWPLAESAALR